ncbi:uncharacterized protein [Lepeophtheirus salmonis]|uniref:uncharacterized protein isoform X1 n=1 Tax=Lepeophtheirus salmonis TaxID=72036 RepID=UPI001AE67078|nr:lamina-associated polypeptide 2, isoforms beta/delta/epsilon/gamma-like isoform X1 [Lepeophtheirus salmonis]
MMESNKENANSESLSGVMDAAKGDVLYDEFVVSAGDRFSSDEEEVILNGDEKKLQGKKKKSSPAKAATNILTEDNAMIVDGLHITDLSDDELFRKLQEYGVDVGPIVDSTRNIYQKKLAILMRGESNFNNSISSHHENGTSNELNGKEEFSADEEALELSPDIKEEETSPIAASESFLKRISRRSNASSVKKISITASPKTINSSMIPDVRPRISSSSHVKAERFTPTPRRSIHSYRGNENEEGLRLRYRVSGSSNVLRQEDRSDLTNEKLDANIESKSVSTCSKILHILPNIFILLVIVATAVYAYQNFAQKKELSKVVDEAINWAHKTSQSIIEKFSSPPIPPSVNQPSAKN